jgi:hypothetical protein
VVIDPSDKSGNTVLLGGAYGGLWKSTNAGSLSSNPGSVNWQALIDDQPSLAVGAIALQPGNSNVILVGTGETNNSGDSYYGLGILRSADGGSSWTQITGIGQPADQSFLGIGFSKIAFSTANPNLVVAATAGDNGLYLGLEEDANQTARGLYYSQDAGVTWNRAILSDASVPASATDVIYNSSQGSGTFYASVQRHGLYSSTDGQHFTPLTAQPGTGIISANCPVSVNSSGCPIYRAEFAEVLGRNEMYAWIVDVQPDSNGDPQAVDEGIWQSTSGGTSWTQIPDNGITDCGDSAFGPESGCGVEQGWYNLALAAIQGTGGAGTDLYAGAINLYKCSLAGGTVCTQGDWINLTHVYGCNPGPLGAPAHVHPDQHAMAFAVFGSTAPGYFAHDGGISRTLDAYAGLNSGSCTGTNQFDSLSQTLGSMTEFVSFSVDPTDADIMLGGTQDNGSPKTMTATENSTWQNALGGDGGFNAINPTNPSEWFAANPYLTILKCELGTACDDAGFNEVVSSATLGGDQGAFYTPYILDPQNPAEMLVGTCRVWRVSTSGSAPLQLSNDFETLGTGVCTGDEINLVNAVAAGGPQDTNNNSTVVYAVTNGYGPLSGQPGGEVWATTNAGVNLMENVTQNVNPNGYAISTVAMDSSDDTGGTAYVGIMGFSTPAFPTSHVWKTGNAGASWSDWSGTGLPDAPVNALLVDSQAGLIYAGTDVGVFVSSTATASWIEVGPTPAPSASGFLPDAPVTALQMFNYGGAKTLLASTYGRGIWSYGIVILPGFTNVISNSPQTVFPSQTATFNGTLTGQGAYASPVNLSCTGPAPSTCTFQPAQVTPTATYTLTANGAVGDYTFNAQAAGTDTSATTHDAAVTLHIVDFNLTAPSPSAMTVIQGSISQPSLFQVTAAGSFAGTVTLSCSSGLPVGATCKFSPSNSVSPTSSAPATISLTVAATGSTAIGGPTTVTITAMTAGAPAPKTQTFTLTVVAVGAGFSWTDTGNASATVLAGQTASYTFSAAPVGSATFPEAINFQCASLPVLTNCVFSPSSILAGAGITPVTLTVSTTGPNLGAGSSVRATAALTTDRIARQNRRSTQSLFLPFFTVGWAIAGTVMFRQRRRPLFWRFRGIAIFCLSLGLIALLSCGGVSGSGGGGSAPPDFSIMVGATPTSTPVNQQVIWNGTLTAENGYDTAVAMSCAGSAPGTCALTPTAAIPTSGGSPFTVTLNSETIGTFNFTIQGTDGTRTHATPTETLTVGTGVTVSPSSVTLFAEEAGNTWPSGVNQQQFAANQAVNWVVTGGNVNGSVTSTGLYTPPPLVPNPATATVTATGAGALGSASVTVIPATPLGAWQIVATATAADGTAHSDLVTLVVK